MFILVILFIILAYIIYVKTSHVRKLAAQFPGERDLPLIGNTHQLGLKYEDFLKNLLNMHKKFNYETFKVYIGPKLFIVMTDPQDVGDILTNTTSFVKEDPIDFLKPWLGEGLLTSQGQKWKNSRKIITPTFHFKILESYSKVMDKQGDKLVTKLRKVADGNVVDTWDFISKCSLDVIAETAMGVPVHAQDNADSEIVRSIGVLCTVFINRVLNPLKGPDFLFNLTDDSTKHNAALKIVKDFNESVIIKRRDLLEEEMKNKEKNSAVEDDDNETGQKKRLAFLDMLMSATIDGRPLTNEEISDEVSTFMFAGHDTVTTTVNFALYNLANNPDIQEKLIKEQIDLLGTDLQKTATYNDLQSMKYLELFIKESLRLFPSAPAIGRRPINDIDINGKLLPAGVNLLLFIYGMHRNPKTFPNPDKLDPDRFLPENRTGKHAYDYIPFSAGPRNCVGQKFAYVEIKSLLAKLVRNFEFSSGGPENAVQPYMTVTLNSVNGIRIRIKPRKY